MSEACERCGRELALAWDGAREAEYGSVAVLLERRPRWACPAGHAGGATARAETDGAILGGAREGLPVAQRGRLRRPDRCLACRAELTLPGRRTLRTVSVVVAGAGVVTVTFDVPMLRCRDCGTEQLPHRAAADAQAALRGALSEA